jgi:hypothetical protein
VQKWKKSGSLQQLALKDAVDIRQTFLYKLASRSNLQHFKNVLLAGKIFTRFLYPHHVNADPDLDPSFHFVVDPDPDPAPRQRDTNMQSLI